MTTQNGREKEKPTSDQIVKEIKNRDSFKGMRVEKNIASQAQGKFELYQRS
jgi:hypothetical protein